MDNKSKLLKDIFVDHLREAMGKEYNSETLAAKLKASGIAITSQTIRDYQQKKWLPKSEVLWALSQFFNRPMDWFFGETETPKPPPELVLQETPRFKTYSDKHRFSKEQYVPIRLLKDEIAAGLPAEIREHDVEGWVLIYASKEWMPHAPENYTCAHIRGYSMAPILEPGDIVAIDHAERDPETLHNKMVVFRDNSGVTVKWLRYVPEHRLVIGEPQNPAEKDSTIYLVGDEIHEKIVGKVAWWWGKR